MAKSTLLRKAWSPKFVEQVEQITFSGRYARETGQEVLYVTERATFQLTNRGVVLKEVAPGIDIQRDVLDGMGFKPIVEDVTITDEKVFTDQPLTFSNF